VSLSDPSIRSSGRTAFAQRLHDEFMLNVSDPRGMRCVVAVGGEARGLVRAGASLKQAMRAVTVATTVSFFGDVVDWEQLGIYRLLAEFPVDRLKPEDIHAGLASLLHDPKAGQLLHTVECYLDNAGDAQATSRQIFVHRTSLYHRLRRFEEAAAADLSSGTDRLMVHLALKLARLQGQAWAPEQPPPS
jgi:DNA-binding PucR family transcriptional regulator